MTKKQWESVYPIFKPTENWGDADKMDYRFVWLLYRARCILGRKIYINRGVDPNGSIPHKNGLAGDLRIEGIHEINIVETTRTIEIQNPDDSSTATKFEEVSEYSLDKNNHPDLFKFTRLMSVCRLGFYPHWKYRGKVWAGIHSDIVDEHLNWWRDENMKYHYNFCLRSYLW